MKNIYVVYRSLAYMEGIVGVYDTEEKAKKALLSAKSDDYHYFTIKKLELNKNELFYNYNEELYDKAEAYRPSRCDLELGEGF